MGTNTIDIYALGHALIDESYSINDEFLAHHGLQKSHRRLIDKQQMHQLEKALATEATLLERAAGGSSANSAVAASLLGAQVYFSCKVGDDANGDFFIESMHDADVRTFQQHHGETGETGICVVLVTPDAERTMNTYTGITDQVGADVIDFDRLITSRLLYIEAYMVTTDSGLSGSLQAIKAAQQHGVGIAINFSDPSMVSLFHQPLKQLVQQPVELIFCNEEEAALWGNGNLERGIADLQQRCQTLVLTRGAQGSVVFSPQQQYRIPAPGVSAVNTTGAGDLYAGAFLYAYVNDYPVNTCAQLATVASAHLVALHRPRLSRAELAQIREQVLGNERL